MCFLLVFSMSISIFYHFLKHHHITWQWYASTSEKSLSNLCLYWPYCDFSTWELCFIIWHFAKKKINSCFYRINGRSEVLILSGSYLMGTLKRDINYLSSHGKRTIFLLDTNLKIALYLWDGNLIYTDRHENRTP